MYILQVAVIAASVLFVAVLLAAGICEFFGIGYGETGTGQPPPPRRPPV